MKITPTQPRQRTFRWFLIISLILFSSLTVVLFRHPKVSSTQEHSRDSLKNQEAINNGDYAHYVDEDDVDQEPQLVQNNPVHVLTQNKALSFPIKTCSPLKQYMGRKEYGGWMICPLGLNSESIVYSFGVGENAEYDQEMIQRFGLKKLYAFDPTPKAIDYVKRSKEQKKLSERFELYPIALTSDPQQTSTQFFLPKNKDHVSGTAIKGVSHVEETEPVTVQTMDLLRIMKMLGHDHIDLLKLDVEGSEFEIFDKFLSDPSKFQYCNQILVEQHARFFASDPTKEKEIVDRMVELFRTNGFEVLHIENGQEYSFVREVRN